MCGVCVFFAKKKKKMEDSKEITINGVGVVRLIKSKRARRLSLKIRHCDEIIVTVPHRMDYQEAERIVIEKADWLRNKILSTPSINKPRKIFDLNSNFETKEHRLAVIPDQISDIKIKVSNGIIKVRYPYSDDIKSKKIQEAIKKGIEKALKIEADNWIPFRVKKFSERHGFKYKNIRFKNARSRWGSCSSDNNLNFNIHLMALPEDLIDYVILHELCHTVEKNHGHRFWSLMDKVLGSGVGQSKFADKQLKKYRIGIW